MASLRQTLGSSLPRSGSAGCETLEQLVAMGMEEGIRLAVGQIDALLG